MNTDEMREISARGRVAYAICCLENILNFKNAPQRDEVEKTLLQQLWHFTTDNMALWQHQVGEMIPFVVNDENQYNNNDFEFLSYSFFNRLREYYKGCDKVILVVINLIYELGTTNLYVPIDNDKLRESTLENVQKIIDLMEQNQIPLPEINLFKAFPITENKGWGRKFVREEIFKEYND